MLSRSSIRYISFNLTLLALLGAWFFYQNRPVDLTEPRHVSDGKLPCVSYAPYYKKGLTPLLPGTHISKSQINRDLQLLSQHFQCVRIYSVNQGLDHVPEAASKFGLKVLLGAWIGWVKADNDKELNLAITLANQYPDTVTGLIVGNEVLLRGEQTESSMRSYLERARQSTKVPVTYADVWEFWLKHKSLEKSVDFVTLHLLPYWEDNPQSIDDSMQHANMVMDKMTSSFTKPLFIGETGWPSVGRQRQASRPSQLNQARYLREFVQLAQDKGWNYNLIEAFDQPWKRGLEGTVGGYWGIYNSDGQAKFGFSGPVAERDDGWRPFHHALFGMAAFIAFALLQKGRRDSSVILSVASLGALAGVSVMLQWSYLASACNTPEDWKALGSMFLAGNLSLVSMSVLLIQNSQSDQAAYTPRIIMRTSLLALLIGAIVTGWLMMMEGRYRDFPLSIFVLPALQSSIGMRLAKVDTRPSWRVYYPAISLAVAFAAACAWLESVNPDALLWLAITILLGVAAWPKKQQIH